MPLTLYSNMYAVPPLNMMTEFTWVSSATCQGVTCYAHVVPEQSYRFHTMLYDRGLAWHMTSWEIDFRA